MICDLALFQIESPWISSRIPIESCTLKSNLLLLKSNLHKWFIRDLNRIAIWICPSLVMCYVMLMLCVLHYSLCVCLSIHCSLLLSIWWHERYSACKSHSSVTNNNQRFFEGLSLGTLSHLDLTRSVHLILFLTFINSNNNHDDIYSAVIMTEFIVRVHSVHLMNAERRQAAADPQTKPHDLGCESACRQLSSTTTIAIYYHYSARKLILIVLCILSLSTISISVRSWDIRLVSIQWPWNPG